MRTIEEAIANERKIVEKCKTEYKLECARYGKRTVESCEKLECIKVAEEHEQLAEWLELLKWYEQGMEDIPCESGVLPKDVYWAGYNKAIDDAKDVILQTLDNEILVDTLHLRLDLLKEGGENEISGR